MQYFNYLDRLGLLNLLGLRERPLTLLGLRDRELLLPPRRGLLLLTGLLDFDLLRGLRPLLPALPDLERLRIELREADRLRVGLADFNCRRGLRDVDFFREFGDFDNLLRGLVDFECRLGL